MEKLKKYNYRYLFDEIGDPGTEEGLAKIKSELVLITFPFTMNDGKVKTASCNRRIANAWKEALEEIYSIYGKDVHKFELDYFAGCFNPRKVKGNSDWWSIHSWGMAIDHNPGLGPFGVPSIMPYQFVQAFKKRGFYWGGDWKRPDGMHFSAING